jgi:imidazolonepropionase-like amidohydrolase
VLYRALLVFSLALIHLPAAVIAIRDVTVIDGSGTSAVQHTTIILRGERIAAVGPARTTVIPKGARVIEGRGRFAIPGLWDMHVHLWDKENPLPLYIAYGITGVRDMGSDFSRTVTWREAAQMGKAVGPHVVTPGPAVDGQPPREPKLPVLVALTPEDGRRAFDRLDDMDVDFVKVLSSLPRDAFFALAERSRKWRVPFAGHVPQAITANEAIDARIASMEHLFGMFAACADDPAHAVETFNEKKACALFQKSALMETRQTPTLTLWERMTAEAANDDNRAALRRQTELAFRMVRLMRDCGVEIMAGTDTGDPGTVPGSTLDQELELLVKAGLTPMQALQSATAIPARFLDWDESVGRLKAGMIADVVLLAGDPLADIRNVRRVEGVAIRGRYFGKAWIEQTRAGHSFAAGRSPAPYGSK